LQLAIQAKQGHSFKFWKPYANNKDVRTAAHEYAARVDLGSRAEMQVANLSHGEQRRLEVAMALASDARLLLLDEPLAGLGPEEASDMISLLETLKGQQTIVLIEHDMLTLSNVVTHYGHSQVLNGINLTINQGQVATLLGRNGMGKTTTINSIMGILPKTSGKIEFDGQNTIRWPSHRVAKLGLGLVPEGRQIFPNLNVHENLIATARQHAQRGQIWDAERVYALFPELAARKASMGNLLSGGEQQMLAIARALMTNPKLLILDEATEGLAPLIRKKIWDSLELIKADGMSILIVDKNLKDLLQIADQHNIIHKGAVVWSGSSSDLEEASDIRSQYLGV